MSRGRDSDRSAAPRGVRRSSHVEGAPAALAAGFYDRDTASVARDLLGRVVVSTLGGGRCSGVIVETEAYVGPDDEASHAHRRFGRTRRNEVMFGAPGTAYVYLVYGMYWCLNAVTGAEGYPAAVLIRALQPFEGIDVARARRPGRSDVELMRGPGKLCGAMAITGAQNGHLLERAPLWIEVGEPVADASVAVGPRIGISRAVDEPLRFWIAGSPWVSRGGPTP